MSVLAIEEIARVDPAVAVVCDVQNTLFINALRHWATDEQQARFFKKLASGTVGAYALSAASSGSDAFALKCAAVPDGDDFVLSGRKLWITNGQEAGLYLVFANADPEQGYRGITAFLVEREMPGFRVGKKEDKLGIRASSTCELILEDVRVPRANVLGDVGKGYKVAIETLNEGRIGIGAQMVGLAQGALDHTISYVKEREQFGRPIGTFQAIKHILADCFVRQEAARAAVYAAGATIDYPEVGNVKRAVASAKLVCGDAAMKNARASIQVHGGMGYTWEVPAHYFLKRVWVLENVFGTVDDQADRVGELLDAGAA